MRRGKKTLLFILVLVVLGLWVVLDNEVSIPLLGKRQGFQLGLDLRGGTHLVLDADFSGLEPGASREEAMDGVVSIIEGRVDKYGVTEPVIQRQPGGERIIVELPGVKNIDEAVKLIGQTAQLEFREAVLDANGEPARDSEGNIQWKPAKDVGLEGKEITLTGAFLKRNTQVVLDPTTSQPHVAFEWNSEGAELFEKITKRNIEKPLGIFLDDRLISAPTVRSVIKEKGIIEGLGVEEARLLSVQLNAGALPVPLSIVEQQDVDAVLGQDSLQKSMVAGITGLIMVLLFMTVYYRLPGFVSCLALLVYGVLVLAVFKLVPVTLTLAGVAAFIISIGMAVDANVLISERMKEELRGGKTVLAAMESGFNRAWSAIRDSNMASLITCAILWWFGNQFGASAVKGFALTLALGVALSMFSAITVSRSLLRLFLGSGLAKNESLFLGAGESHDKTGAKESANA
ncbi:MAG: secD [Dehalococcoidia bacterium]|nr:secD [Dehalococcoidia bacterium]